MAKKPTFDEIPNMLAQLLEEVTEIKKMLQAREIPAQAENEPALQSVSDHSVEPPLPSREITIDKASELLKRSKQTVYALVKSGILKSRKHGRNLIFDENQVMAYMNEREKTLRKRTISQPTNPPRKQTKKQDETETAEKPVEGRQKRQPRRRNRDV